MKFYYILINEMFRHSCIHLQDDEDENINTVIMSTYYNFVYVIFLNTLKMAT